MSLADSLAIGLGMDSHRLVDGGPLVLGGVEIPFPKRMHGHSDGDCLVHAILDALLSAGAQPDLGSLFSDTDDANKDRSSLDMAREVSRRLKVAGARILSIDALVICDEPKVAPLREAMCRAIAEALDIEVGRLNVKGKTSEGMGALGRGEGIEARAVALVERGQVGS